MKINLTELLRNSPGSPTALSAVLLAFLAPPLAAQEADPEAGRAIFTETAQPQCALCHVLAEAEALTPQSFSYKTPICVIENQLKIFSFHPQS